MGGEASKTEDLREFLDDFHDGKQKNLADTYGLSPSVVSGWLNPEGERGVIPRYMQGIMRLERQVAEISKELTQLRAGRVVQMKSGHAIVQFSDSTAPGTIVCKGIPDLETANSIAAGLLKVTDPAHSKKEL